MPAEHPAADGEQPPHRQRGTHVPELPSLHLPRRGRSRGRAGVDMPASPAQLLLALAEHDSLDSASAALGISKDDARRLLRGAAKQLASAHVPREENAVADEMSNRAINEQLNDG